VAQIYYYLLEQKKGSACIDHAWHTHKVRLSVDDLCVSSSLVSNIQGFVAGDPGNCRDKMYGPTSLAPQLGCNQWAWFSSADAILQFLQTAYGQAEFTTGRDFVQALEDAAGAGISPADTEARPVTWAKATMFCRNHPLSPQLLHPGGQALAVGPGTGTFTYMSDRTSEPKPPSAKQRGALNWWKGSDFLVTDCPPYQGDFTEVCKESRAVLSNLGVLALESILAENLMEITGCPWTRGAQAPPGLESRGASTQDYFDNALATGVYSCTGAFKNVASCMFCPKDSTCLAPDADQVAAGFRGCGLEEAKKCHSASWFGKLRPLTSFPTKGCSEEWKSDMYQWLADPRKHLWELAQKKPGTVTAIEAINTMMFVFDNLFAAGHGGWDYFGGFINMDDDGNPTCSTTGAVPRSGYVSPGTQCGKHGNLPCCVLGEEGTPNSVSLASSGGPNVEWVTKNSVPGPCVTTINICGPDGEGPQLGKGTFAKTFTCS